MMIREQLPKGKRWAFALIFFILLFNLPFLSWSTNLSDTEKLASWAIAVVVALALSVLDPFLRGKAEKIYLTVLYLLSLVPNLTVWSYLCISGLYMKRDMFWVIFNSNMSESKEYMQQFFTWQILAAIAVYLAVGIFLLAKARSARAVPAGRRPWLFTSAVLIVALDVAMQYLSQAVPMFEFYKSYLAFRIEYYAFEKEAAIRTRLKMDVKCQLSDTTRHVTVILLGESTTPCHMSLYGYFRPTTPLMDARSDELHVYTDVVTPDTHTYGVMQKALTFANHAHPEYYKTKPSVVELFNSAGFETYWIANNPILDKWGASYGVIAHEAKHVYDVSVAKQPDEAVLPYIYKILADTSTRNKIIFVHLMGNHHAYESRYPKSFDHFDHERDSDLPDLGFRTGQMKTTIDRYDNAVRYADYLFDTILNALDEADVPACLLFFSDHGEEVFDTRNACGHRMSNVYPCQSRIPFILWLSKAHRAESHDLVIDPSRPYSIENVIYSISTLSRLQYADNDPSLSIFSAEYIEPAKRMVGKETYDDILKKTQDAPEK
jgi:heptose-I-phosphate ethanolaminephosphotransferase